MDESLLLSLGPAVNMTITTRVEAVALGPHKDTSSRMALLEQLAICSASGSQKSQRQ